jgi:hypothetical protein
MRILILDDDQFRHNFFRESFIADEVISVHKFSEFLHHLHTGSPWDLIHLDHDLCDLVEGDTFVDDFGKQQEFNGQHAAWQICQLTDNLLPKQIIIQSVNDDGALAMLKIIKARGVEVKWEPFAECPPDLEVLHD